MTNDGEMKDSIQAVLNKLYSKTRINRMADLEKYTSAVGGLSRLTTVEYGVVIAHCVINQRMDANYIIELTGCFFLSSSQGDSLMAANIFTTLEESLIVVRYCGQVSPHKNSKDKFHIKWRVAAHQTRYLEPNTIKRLCNSLPMNILAECMSMSYPKKDVA